MFDLLKDELSDNTGNPYYIIIDELDEAWADDRIRYNLIHALIETVQDFHRMKFVKIVLCLRTDLIERVAKQIKGAGYQEEKIKSLFLYLTWTPAQLTDLLDRRIHQLVRDSFTNATITHKELLPNMGRRSETAINYILERTMQRPRDVITFFNYCIKQAVDRPDITKQILMQAEGEYSVDRRRSLEQEWQADYPELHAFIDLFKKRPHEFRLREITDEDLLGFTISFLSRRQHLDGTLGSLAVRFESHTITGAEFRASLAAVLYSIGFLGIKTESYRRIQWIEPESGSLTTAEIHDDCNCSVHKMYWQALGISPERDKG
jgi:hypothetical protein